MSSTGSEEPTECSSPQPSIRCVSIMHRVRPSLWHRVSASLCCPGRRGRHIPAENGVRLCQRRPRRTAAAHRPMACSLGTIASGGTAEIRGCESAGATGAIRARRSGPARRSDRGGRRPDGAGEPGSDLQSAVVRNRALWRKPLRALILRNRPPRHPDSQVEIRPSILPASTLHSPCFMRVSILVPSVLSCENPAPMCHRIECSRCGKPTWAGCGQHIEQALAGVPPGKRCTCPPPKTLLQRLLGRDR
jgi:hypothetical protein